MADPATLEEYNRLQNARTRMEGFFDQVTVYSPCPFCCAPDVMAYRMLDVRVALTQTFSCGECMRAFAFVVSESPGQLGFELVQVRGPDPAPYLPKMRRVQEVVS